jgi:phage replication initiation protein
MRAVPLPAEGAHPFAAITDWLNFSFPVGSFKVDRAPLFQRLFDVLGSKCAPAVERPSGRYNYERSFTLGQTKAFFAFGGNRDTALVSLPGEVCALVMDWQALVALGRDELGGRITRWDGAIDDYLGVHSVDHAMAVYKAGAFNAGGHNPQYSQHGPWEAPDGHGRSFQVGRRENGKRLLIYEKGMQLGARWHPWTRWELSLGNKGRVIPWEVILEPGRYVAGAYPKALAWVDKEMSRVVTLQKQTQIGYETAVENARQQAGHLIDIMMQVEGSAEAVIEKLRRPGVPRRLRHPAVENPEGWIE